MNLHVVRSHQVDIALVYRECEVPIQIRRMKIKILMIKAIINKKWKLDNVNE